MIKKFSAAAIALGSLVQVGCQDGQHPERYLQGVVEYEERAMAFEVGGRLVAMKVRRGDEVKSGQLLAAIDDELETTQREARAAEAVAADAQLRLLKEGPRREEVGALALRVSAARASEKRLALSLERERALRDKGVSPPAKVDDLEQQLAQAIANRRALEQDLAALRKGARQPEIEAAAARRLAAEKAVALGNERIARHTLRAPMSGVVLDVHLDPGEVVIAGTPVLTLGDTAEPYVDVFVPIGKLGGVKLGSHGTVRIDGSDHAFAARVDWIARKTEFTPRYLFSDRERPNLVVRVRLVIDDADARVHAGMPAFATIDGAAE